jgi:hypothetical protein
MIITLVCVLIACVIIGIIGITTKHYAYLALLPFGLFGGITGFMYGLRGEPSVSIDPPGTGGTFFNLPGWVIAVDAVLLVIGIVVIVLAR